MIEYELLQFFQSRWTAMDEDVIKVESLIPPLVTLSNMDNDYLMRSVDDKDIKETLRSMAKDKALDPNGFPPYFFQILLVYYMKGCLYGSEVVFYLALYASILKVYFHHDNP